LPPASQQPGLPPQQPLSIPPLTDTQARHLRFQVDRPQRCPTPARA
jgi:hypothetical protein